MAETARVVNAGTLLLSLFSRVETRLPNLTVAVAASVNSGTCTDKPAPWTATERFELTRSDTSGAPVEVHFLWSNRVSYFAPPERELFVCTPDGAWLPSYA